jgi:hypothetical protein
VWQHIVGDSSEDSTKDELVLRVPHGLCSVGDLSGDRACAGGGLGDGGFWSHGH